MQKEDFLKALETCKPLLEPTLYAALVKSVDTIPDEDKAEFVKKFQEAAQRMQDVSDYMEKRVEIQEKGAEKLAAMHEQSTQVIKKVESAEREHDEAEAEELIK